MITNQDRTRVVAIGDVFPHSSVSGNFWSDDRFEDAVVRATIAIYENKSNPCELNAASKHGFHLSHVETIRRHGVFIPAPDRCIISEDGFNSPALLPIHDMPERGCVSLGKTATSYCFVMRFQRITKLPSGFSFVAPGLLYEALSYWPQENGPIEGTRQIVSVNSRTGRITPCQYGNQRGRAPRPICDAEMRSTHRLCHVMQLSEDSRHQWTITAENDDSRITVGAYPESVKSLLYSRDLPVTASGRKRPILHAVSAHRRRMAVGTDVDVRAFLRGSRQIEMAGARFTVNASQDLIEKLASQPAKRGSTAERAP